MYCPLFLGDYNGRREIPIRIHALLRVGVELRCLSSVLVPCEIFPCGFDSWHGDNILLNREEVILPSIHGPLLWCPNFLLFRRKSSSFFMLCRYLAAIHIPVHTAPLSTTIRRGINSFSLSREGPSQSRGLMKMDMMMKVGIVVSTSVLTCQRRTFQNSHPPSTLTGACVMNVPL